MLDRNDLTELQYLVKKYFDDLNKNIYSPKHHGFPQESDFIASPKTDLDDTSIKHLLSKIQDDINKIDELDKQHERK